MLHDKASLPTDTMCPGCEWAHELEVCKPTNRPTNHFDHGLWVMPRGSMGRNRPDDHGQPSIGQHQEQAGNRASRINIIHVNSPENGGLINHNHGQGRVMMVL